MANARSRHCERSEAIEAFFCGRELDLLRCARNDDRMERGTIAVRFHRLWRSRRPRDSGRCARRPGRGVHCGHDVQGL